MKRFIFFSISLIFISCSIQVKTVYEPKTDFNKYKNFCWLKSCEFTFRGPGGLNDSLIRERMQMAIKKEMKKKGVIFNSAAPDLLMDVQVVIKTDTAYLYQRSDDMYTYIPFSTMKEVMMYKGTLVIDMIDQKKGKMVWRSVAVSYFDLHPDWSEKNIGKGIASALKRFPPKP
jgi:hypothetical protein